MIDRPESEPPIGREPRQRAGPEAGPPDAAGNRGSYGRPEDELVEGEGYAPPDLRNLIEPQPSEPGSRLLSWAVVLMLALAALGVGYAVMVWP